MPGAQTGAGARFRGSPPFDYRQAKFTIIAKMMTNSDVSIEDVFVKQSKK